MLGKKVETVGSDIFPLVGSYVAPNAANRLACASFSDCATALSFSLSLDDFAGNFVGVTTSAGGEGEVWLAVTSERHSSANASTSSSRSSSSSSISSGLMNGESITEYPVELGLFGKYFYRSVSVKRDFWRAVS